MKITYVGNISKDNIMAKNKKNETSIGGSAVYSSFATKFIDSHIDVEVIGNASRKYVEILKKNNITFLGKTTTENTEFFIDELNGTCIGKNYSNISFYGNLKTDHLHISFRKGIDVDSIIQNNRVTFKSLSVDVMIHSVKECVEKIKKYKDIINILFCNLDEYRILEEHIRDIPIVVITNNKHPVIIRQNEKNFIAKVRLCENIISDTGAGDSFIGGFLGEYLNSKDLYRAVNSGINASNLSLSNIGPLIKKENNIKVKKTKLLKLPDNIIVIGNSCAGKTTFVNEFNKYFDIYSSIDDLAPLQEVFYLDDKLRENKKFIFDKEFENKIKYCKEIIEQYKKEYPNIEFYTNLSVEGKGHDIVKPILWDKILEYALKNNNSSNKIIQFARGRDEFYEKKYGKDIYQRSIETICKNLKNKEEILIINVKAPYKSRVIRNENRAKEGGHYVSSATMKQVYYKDYFNSEKYNNFSVINLDSKKILVYNLINQQVAQDNIEKCMKKQICKIIKKYNKFKEEYYGTKKNSEGYFSK